MDVDNEDKAGFTQYMISGPPPSLHFCTHPLAAALSPLAYSRCSVRPLAYRPNLTHWNKGDGGTKMKGGGGPNIQYCDWADKARRSLYEEVDDIFFVIL